ncbi:hypothetical protein Bbelb_370520 [Branchiostoma belcheri]|nr:hypothetical protein Bbelb_370520 [Branchiostoma belcheri]
MLRRVHNVHWEQHLTNKELYAGLPKLTTKIRTRRLRFAGHTLRNCREIASNLVLWSPAHGRRRPGRPPLTYPDVLRRDVGLQAQDMGKAMQDRDYWAAMVVLVVTERDGSQLEANEKDGLLEVNELNARAQKRTP